MSATGRSDVRRADDHYQTPDWCVEALLERVPLHGPVLDPCCGEGAILRVLDNWGVGLLGGVEISEERAAKAYDVASIAVGDYLTATFDHTWTANAIVTNPPFSLAEPFIRRALEFVAPGGDVIMLLRLNFLGARCRNEAEWSDYDIPLWGLGQLRAVYVLPRRPSFTGGGNDACEYAWFHWERDYRGPAVLDWLEAS